jgi:hypothetical protein
MIDLNDHYKLTRENNQKLRKSMLTPLPESYKFKGFSFHESALGRSSLLAISWVSPRIFGDYSQNAPSCQLQATEEQDFETPS